MTLQLIAIISLLPKRQHRHVDQALLLSNRTHVKALAKMDAHVALFLGHIFEAWNYDWKVWPCLGGHCSWEGADNTHLSDMRCGWWWRKWRFLGVSHFWCGEGVLNVGWVWPLCVVFVLCRLNQQTFLVTKTTQRQKSVSTVFFTVACSSGIFFYCLPSLKPT